MKNPQLFTVHQKSKPAAGKKESSSKGKQDRKEERKNKKQSGKFLKSICVINGKLEW